MAPRRLRVARIHKTRFNSSKADADEDSEEDEAPKPALRLRPNGALFLLLLFASSLAGHYFPILWPQWSLFPEPASSQMRVSDVVRRTALSDAGATTTGGQLSSAQQQEPLRQQSEQPGIQKEEASHHSQLQQDHPHDQLQQQQQQQQQPQQQARTAAFSRPTSSLLKKSLFKKSTGDAWQSIFVHGIRIRMRDEPACKGIIPAQYHTLNETASQPITKLDDLLRPNQRVLAFLPRHGLGNSLRSYVSAYVFSLLSGRRLVRLHAAEHAKVYDLLCDSFVCGFDSIRWANKSGFLPMEIYRQFGMMKPFYFLETYKKNSDIADSIHSEYPIFATRSGSHFDVYWHRREGFKECVYAAFKCSSIWCVHSRAMYALVGRGGPTKNLDFVMSNILHRHEPVNASTQVMPLASIPKGKRAVFDIALHVRTRTLAIEKAIKRDTERYTDSECEDPDDSQGTTNKFLKKCLWDCIGLILETLRSNLQATLAGGASRGLTILLATDDAELRPEFVRRLEPHGTVFYSQGTILHTSKADGSLIMRLPTMAEFFLMAKSHTLIEAGSYISTFAYFSGLVGNGTLAAVKMKGGGCRLKLEHKAELM